MRSSFRNAWSRARARQVSSSWPKRRISGEWLEPRTLLSANLNFAIAGSSPVFEQGLAVRTDAAGNVYELTTQAVLKYSPAGALVWSTSYSASAPGGFDPKEGLALDGAGDIYITGNFSNGSGSPATFGLTSLVSAGGDDGFLAKLDSNGNFLWAESFGGTGDDSAYAVATDAAGNAYLTGHISGTATIGTVTSARTLNAGTGQDILVAKFDTSGALVWANVYGNNGSSNDGRGIAVDGQGNVYATGEFAGTVNFGGTQLNSFFGTTFLLKLGSNGRLTWAKELNSAGGGQAEGYAITVDTAGNVYSTGRFGGDIDLNPNGGDEVTIADFVFEDAYVLKLDAAGNFVWAADLHHAAGLGSLRANDIAVGAQGNVYTTGWFDGTANFAPNSQYLVTSAGSDDIYVSALNSRGSFLWAATAGESSSDQGYGVAASPGPGGDYIYATGAFSGTINFNSGLGPADNLTAAGAVDSFLWGIDSLTTRINGVVWNDQNGDGVRQSSEPGVPNVTVQLFYGTPGSGTQVASTLTDALGLYSFNGVAPGTNYYVQVPAVGGDILTTENAGTDPTIASNVDPTTDDSNAISITAGQTVLVNAGLQTVVLPLAVNLASATQTLGTGSSIIADAAGNFYVGGTFDGKTTFGSGAGAVTLTTGGPSDFIAKYASNGALLWVTPVVNGVYQYAPKLGFDSAGDIYMAGEIDGSATIGTVSLTTPIGTTTAYLAKLTPNGNTLWATTVIPNATDYNVGLAVDPQGNAYVVGGFTGNPTVNTSPQTTLTNAGGNDAFIVKYSSSGAAQWAVSYGGTKDDAADSVAVDPSGNPIVTGVFNATATFGGTQLVSGGTGVNDFVAKLNAANGSVMWADALTSSVSSGQILFDIVDPLNRIAIDAQGNVYTTGYFDGTIQLDPTGGTDAITGTNSTFVSKLDNNGNFIWGKAFTNAPNGYDVEGRGIAVDSKDDVFTTGEFAQTINFNPNGSPAQNLTSNGSFYSIFLSELDTNGNFVSVQQFGGAGEDEADAVSVDPKDNVYITGGMDGVATFGTFTVGTSGDFSLFAARLGRAGSNPAVNKPPSFTILGPLQAVGLNAGLQTVPNFIGNIVPGLPGDANEVVNFIVTTDNPSLFTPTGQPAIDANGTLTYTPAAGAAGTANVTVVAHNNGGTANGGNDTSAAQTFPITVDVNHAPTFTVGKNQTVNENSVTQTVAGWATNISAGPPDEASQTLTFTATYQVTAGGPDVLPGGVNAGNLFTGPITIDPLTGNLSFTPAPNEWGTALVTVTLQDNGGTANGGQDTSAPQTFTITVNLVNQAPSFSIGKDQTVLENSGPQSVTNWATSISAGPPSEANQTLAFNVISDSNPALFASAPQIDPTTGTLTYTPATDISGTAAITIDLQDSGGMANGGHNTSASQTFNITVNFVNQPPTFVAGGNVEVLENSGAKSISPWAKNISPGAPQELAQKLTFLITTQSTPPGLFSVAPSIDSAGNLTFTPATDTFGTAQVSVQLQDDGREPDGTFGPTAISPPQTFTITVDLANHAPSFQNAGNQAADENSGPQSVTGWATSISAGPASEAGQTLNFIVTPDNSALFSSPPAIDPATGDLTYTPAADVSGTTLVSVQLHDNGGTAFGGQDTSPAQTFTITVNFVNQVPAFTAGTDQVIHETPGPQTVGWATNISAGDAEENNQELTFVVSTDNDALFSSPPTINPVTGKLSYTPAVYAVGVAHVTVQLQDDGREPDGTFGPTAISPPQTFTITVTPSNQAPTFTPGPDQVLSGSFGEIAVPGWATNISAGPPVEAGQSLNFIVSTDNNALFAVPPAIDPTTGDLTFTPVPQMSGQAHVTVQLHDNGGTANGGVDTSPPITFLISITFVNQAPSFTVGANESVLENGGPQAVAGWATNMLAGPPDEASQSLNFIVSSDNNSLFSVPPAIDPITGNLAYTPAPDANGVAHVSVQLHDNGGTANGGQDTSAPQTFAITVVPVNQPPFFTVGQAQQVLENPGTVTVKKWATGISAGAANETSQGLNFLITTDNSTLFPTPPSIDPTTGNLVFTPATDEVGTATVSVALHDNGGTAFGGQDTSAAQSFTITVLPVNQPPVFTLGPNQVVNEEAGAQSVTSWVVGIGPGGPNEIGQALNFIISTDDPGLFSALPQIDVASGTLTYTIAPHTSGTADVSVQLHDDGGTANGGQDTSAPQIFTITANFVNDPPSFALAGNPPPANENNTNVTDYGFASRISPSSSYPPDANEGGQTVHFNVTASNPSLFSTQPTIDPSGNLHYAPAANASGTSTVTVDLQDDGGTANGGHDTSAPQTFTITVNFVNQPPTITHIGANPVANEDSGQATVAGFASATSSPAPGGAPQQITYLLQAANSSLFTTGGQPAIDASGTLTFTPAPLAYGTTSVTLVAQNSAGTDNGGINTSLPAKFFIEIDKANHAPTVANPLLALTVKESNQAFSQALALSRVFDDIDVDFGLGDHLTLSLASNTKPSLVAASLSGSDPASAQLTLNFQPDVSGSATIDLRATDQAGATADDMLQVTVNAEPLALNHSYVLSTGAASSATVANGVLVGDTDPAGLPLTARLVSGPTNGSLVLNADGSFTYTKGPNFSGLDSFTYQVTDGASTSGVATVQITSYEATIVTKLYNQVLGRSPDTGGLEFWVNQIQQGQPYGAVAQGIFDSHERLDPIIQGYYQQFLGRPADADGLSYWYGVWVANGGPEPVVAGMIGSPEFFAMSGQANPTLSPNAAWVTALYERLLDRSPDPKGLTNWTNLLDTNALSPDQVVAGFNSSPEYYQKLTNQFFQQYLGRNPSTSELASYVAMFETGATQSDIQIQIVDSPAYASSPSPPAVGTVDQLS